MASNAMRQREIQMSIEIARARESLLWTGGLYSFFLAGTGLAVAAGQRVPKPVAIPFIVFGVGVANLYDLAYGNKLQRVIKEAEHILQNERSRLVPAKQAPFYKMYTDDEKEQLEKSTKAVSTYYPWFLPMNRKDE